jgi:DNA-directed RNA polymerase subunit RPC12/RpoP
VWQRARTKEKFIEQAIVLADIARSGILSYQRGETMKTKEGRIRMSISLPAPMVEWLRQEAESEMDDISGVIKRNLLPAMRKQEESKKGGNPSGDCAESKREGKAPAEPHPLKRRSAPAMAGTSHWHGTQQQAGMFTGWMNRWRWNMPDVNFRCSKCGKKMVVDSRACGLFVKCQDCGNQIAIPHLKPQDPWSKERDRDMAQILANGDDLAKVEYQESNDYPEGSGDPCRPLDGVIFSISGKDKRFPSYQDLINAGLWHSECLCGISFADETLCKDEIVSQANRTNVFDLASGQCSWSLFTLTFYEVYAKSVYLQDCLQN